MEKLSKNQEIITILFKDFLTFHNSRTISKIIGISHAGAFKILKKLEKRNIVKAEIIGKANIYSLNFENPIACKEIEMALIIESQNNKRWIEEFIGLKNEVKFTILFGSVIRNEKSARDIDLLVIADKNKFKNIRKIIDNRNKLSNKKTHLLFQTLEDFKGDVSKRNKTIIEVIKTGIVLFGQDEFRKTLGELR